MYWFQDSEGTGAHISELAFCGHQILERNATLETLGVQGLFAHHNKDMNVR